MRACVRAPPPKKNKKQNQTKQHQTTNNKTPPKNQPQRSIFNGYAMYIAPELLARMPTLTIVLDNNVTIAIPSDQYTQVNSSSIYIDNI